MAQFTPPEEPPTPNPAPDAVYVSRGQSERPRGVGLSALALLLLLAISIIQRLLKLWGGDLLDEWSWSASYPSRSTLVLQICTKAGIGMLCIWQYWKGRSWARLLVLLWSFAMAAWALSFLSEHNFDPAALMGHPISFFQAVLAAVLLYWLNTPRVRAWFKKSSAAGGELIGERLRGRLCTEVHFHPDTGKWRLYFEHDAELTLRCPWRIVLDDNLAFATGHDGAPSWTEQASRRDFAPLADQQPPETVPAPGRSPQEARRLLENLRVKAVAVRTRSSDLFVSFEMGIELQTWRAPGKSGPAPLWEYSDPALTVIASETEVKMRLAAAPGESEV